VIFSMPELPEVETIKRDLSRLIIGQGIEDVFVRDDRVIKSHKLNDFISSLKSKTVQGVDRRGKLIVISFKEGGYLLAHLKMTGQLIYGERLNLKETKVVFKLSRGQYLNYNDHRLFGRLSFVRQLQDEPFLNAIGPEPLKNGFNTEWLSRNLKRRSVSIKTLLLDQHFVAGIGNIYASEILFDAGINPLKPASRLTKKEVASLYQSTLDILREAIQYRGCSMRNYRDASGEEGKFLNRVRVYNREHQPCRVCGTMIQRMVQNGRSTYFCQRCQQ